MNIQTLVQELDAGFARQIQLADKLLQLLQNEHKALSERQYENSQAIIGEKESTANKLEQEASKQRKLLETAGLPYQADSFDKVLKAIPETASIKTAKLKQQLESLLEKCQEQNLVNGQIIAINQQSAETALAILRGQLANDNIGYNEGGKAVTETSSTTITKA